MALNKALGTDLSALAQIIQSKGRGRDTVLAHITPQEAALLKKRGGRGSTNPDTGLPEFEDDFGNAYQPAEGYVARPETVNPEQYNLTMRQQDYAQSPANPYTDANLFPGNAPPAEGQATMYSPTGAASYGTPQTLQAGYSQDVADLAAGQYAGAVPQGQAISGGTVGQGTVYSPTGGVYSPAQLDQFAVGQTPTTPKAPEQGILKDALAALGKPDTLGRLGLVSALGAYGAMQGKQAATQSAEATSQKSAIAAPYQQQGQQLIGAAQRGELTPANQQVIQQQRARLAQAASNMGGVGQQQIENQISTLTSQLIENQYQYGLQVLQIGDNIELGAINTQLQLDQQLNAANKSFYTSLAQLAAGSPMYVPGLYPSTPTRT